jgi:hypothetical protein
MDSDDEQVDVLRIRMWNPQHATAMLSEFHLADRVLARWGDRPDCNPVGFEVTFVDGYIVRGCYEFFRKGKRRCLFSTYVRRLLRSAAFPAGQAMALANPAVSRYLVPA